MSWLICFLVSAVILLTAIICAIVLAKMKYKSRRIFTPSNTLSVGVFLSAFALFIPICLEQFGDYGNLFQIVLVPIHNAIRLFAIDNDYSVITENTAGLEPLLGDAFRTLASIVFVLAPIMTFRFILSFFKNASSLVKYCSRYFRDVYAFSELSERSLVLAESIRANHKDATLVFTDVFETKDEHGYELLERAKEAGAICFKKDILSVNFKLHGKKSKMTFFIVGEDDSPNGKAISESINQATNLISAYSDRDNTHLYFISTDIASELIFSGENTGKIKVRRINEVRSLIYRTVYDDGIRLYKDAVTVDDSGEKVISAVVIGLGMHGTEMLKTLSWYCQMDGYHVEINAFDFDKSAESRIRSDCPELMTDEFNKIPGEAKYSIRVHPGIGVDTLEFDECIKSLRNTTYVFVALGNDEKNIKTAVRARMLFERMGIKPWIQAVVYNTNEKNALAGIANYKGVPYDIDFIGDLKTSYSEKVILEADLEKAACDRHTGGGKQSDTAFWAHEYNYRSSVAAAIHIKLRRELGVPGAGKTEEELAQCPEEREHIEIIEHRRWNAYMRSIGYISSGSPDPKTRNDLAKMHNCLVRYDILSDEDKRKDSQSV